MTEHATAMPPQYAKTVVIGNVKCHRCSYNLRGLIASGKCPECGASVWDSVQATVDQELLRLPQLSRPKAVGNGLFLFMVSVCASVMLYAACPIAMRVDAWAGPGHTPMRNLLPSPLWLWQMWLGGGALVGLLLLMPRRSDKVRAATWGHIGLLLGGISCWWSAALWEDCKPLQRHLLWHQLADDYGPLVMMVGVALLLLGLRGVLQGIGQRSRAYRTSTTGRQNIGVMLATLAAMVIGRALQVIGAILPPSGGGYQWREMMLRIGATLIWIGGLMLVIGLGYLLMNAWWIRNALVRPVAWYGQLLMPPLPEQTVLGDDKTQFEVRIRPEVQKRPEGQDRGNGGEGGGEAANERSKS